MDWNALGTWAAVIVALGLALREGCARSSERRAAHLLTCARILPSAIRMDQMLRDTLDESEIIHAPSADASLLLDACGTFAKRLDANGLGRFRGGADQQGALPPGMLVPLIKVLMLEEMLLENHLVAGARDTSREDALAELELDRANESDADLAPLDHRRGAQAHAKLEVATSRGRSVRECRLVRGCP